MKYWNTFRLIIGVMALSLGTVNVAFGALWPITKPTGTNTLPTGWTFWKEAPLNGMASFSLLPVANVAIRMGNTKQWNLSYGNPIPVVKNQSWTFKAIVSGMNTGEASANGFGGLNIKTLNANKGVIKSVFAENSSAGTFTWQLKTITVTIPEGVNYIVPEFRGAGGGAYAIAAAAFDLTANSPNLPGVTGPFPPIEPAADNVYGNIIEAVNGNNLIFDPATMEAAFLASTYALDGHIANLMSWKRNESNTGPLHLGSKGTWSHGSATWRITAPAGKVFSGGTVKVAGNLDYQANLRLEAHSAYWNDGYGMGGYILGKSGILYGEDVHIANNGMGWSEWEVQIPRGKKEFFLSVSMRKPQGEAFVRKMELRDVVLTTLPAIDKPAAGIALPTGWGFWMANAQDGGANYEPIPMPSIRVGMTGTGQWSLSAGAKIPVVQNQKWTFTAVIGGDKAGMMTPSGYAGLGIVATNSAGAVVDYNLGGTTTCKRGNLPWQSLSITVTVPAGVKFLGPRFWGAGGGDYYIASATFENSDLAAKLPFDNAFPPGTRYYEQFPTKVSVQRSTRNLESIHLRRSDWNSNSDWNLSFPSIQNPITGKWTLTAIIGARNWGWINPNGFVTLRIDESFKDRPEIVPNYTPNETAPSKDFTWKIMTFEITTTASTKEIRPMVYGRGECELYVASYKFEAGTPAPQSLPTASVPYALGYDVELPTDTTGMDFFFDINEPFEWLIIPEATEGKVTIPYKIVDGHGIEVSKGIALPGSKVTFAPPQAGFLELRVDTIIEAASYRGKVKMTVGAMRIGQSTDTWKFGGNPFGLQVEPGSPFLKRLGCTWRRPLYYNINFKIQEDGKKTLPTANELQSPVPSAYSTQWKHTLEGRVNMPVSRPLPSEIHTVELWNEPENELRKAPNSETDYSWFGKEYSDMIKQSALGIQAYNIGKPSTEPITKIGINFALVNFGEFNKGAWNGDSKSWSYYDIAMIHPYSLSRGNNSYVPQGPEKNELIEWLDRYRKSVDANSQSATKKPLWSNEFGWSTNFERYPGYAVSELAQARFTVRSALIQLAFGVEKVLPSDHMDDGGHFKRNLNWNGSIKPAYAAYAVLARVIDDLPYVGRFEVSGNVAAFLFGNSTKSVLVLWSAKESLKKKINFHPGEPSRKFVNMFGSNGKPSWEQDFEIGHSPIYLMVDKSWQDTRNTVQMTFTTFNTGRGTLAAFEGQFSGVTDDPIPLTPEPISWK